MYLSTTIIVISHANCSINSFLENDIGNKCKRHVPFMVNVTDAIVWRNK